MNELSASEGVFTTAQAARLDITRNALAHACAVGRAERICHGAYRLTGTPALETDELTAIWKLTKPSLFTWERQRTWDGIAIGGHTAACTVTVRPAPAPVTASPPTPRPWTWGTAAR